MYIRVEVELVRPAYINHHDRTTIRIYLCIKLISITRKIKE